MIFFLIASIVLNLVLVYLLYFLWKKSMAMAKLIFLFEDTAPELIELNNKSIMAANSILDNEYFVVTPEAGERFNLFIQNIKDSKNATLRVIQLLEEVSSSINTTVEIKIKENSKVTEKNG